ncbi:MAG: RnfABCDGE type electron transport complex subunit G [Alphaproteobacteria bacterium]|nr:RnfABCDGE type electron transport complex subunit G [Alphaproteobacteria bacterium]
MVAAAALAMGYNATAEDIAKRKAEDLMASLVQVIPSSVHDNELLADRRHVVDRVVYRAKAGPIVTAAAYEVTVNGYAGPIRILMGVTAKGEILGVRVLSHSETPGLGDKIEVAKNDWVRSFERLSLVNTSTEQWAVKKDGGRFDQFSGATITPRAVVKAVKAGLDFFDTYRFAIVRDGGEVKE